MKHGRAGDSVVWAVWASERTGETEGVDYTWYKMI